MNIRTSMQVLFITTALIVPTALWAAPPPPPAPPPTFPDAGPESFRKATFEFQVKGLSAPVVVFLLVNPEPNENFPRIERMKITYKRHAVTVGKEMLADVVAPNLTWLRVNGLELKGEDAGIAVYFENDDPRCANEILPQCGIVGFNWTVGKGVKKYDERKR